MEVFSDFKAWVAMAPFLLSLTNLPFKVRGVLPKKTSHEYCEYSQYLFYRTHSFSPIDLADKFEVTPMGFSVKFTAAFYFIRDDLTCPS